MATIRIILVILCFGFAEWHPMPARHLLKQEESKAAALIKIASHEIGVREEMGHNDGKMVAAYLKSVGLKVGAPWCAAFVSWVYQQAGYPQPRTGWSPSLFNQRVHQQKAAAGQVFGIWFPELQRIAHVGFIAEVQGNWIISVEGNSNTNGSREGDGVYRKRRPLHLLHDLADWLPGKEKRE